MSHTSASVKDSFSGSGPDLGAPLAVFGQRLARREGRIAYDRGQLWGACPYRWDTEACTWWRRGWTEASAEAAYHREARG
jgi:hypothetical protein